MPSDLLSIAVEAAQAGAEELRRRFRRSDLQVAEKAHNDLVTAADRASEEAILAVLHRHRPQDAVLAEESGRHGGGAGEVQWIVDPLDGTANFAHGLPVFTVAVACKHGGELQAGVVLDPVADDLFAAARGEGATWNGRPIRVSERDSLSCGTAYNDVAIVWPPGEEPFVLAVYVDRPTAEAEQVEAAIAEIGGSALLRRETVRAAPALPPPLRRPAW